MEITVMNASKRAKKCVDYLVDNWNVSDLELVSFGYNHRKITDKLASRVALVKIEFKLPHDEWCWAAMTALVEKSARIINK